MHNLALKDRLKPPAIDPEYLPIGLRSYSYYSSIRGITPVLAARILEQQVDNLVRRGGKLVLLDEKNFAICSRRDFDTDFFSKEIWRLDILFSENEPATEELFLQIDELVRSQNCALLTADLSPNILQTPSALHRAGFYLIDSKITNIFYADDYAATPLANSHFTLREAKRRDLPILQDLAARGISDSAIGRDPHFAERADQSASLYPLWVKKAVTHEWADRAYLAETGAGIKGFTCFRFDKLFRQVTEKVITDSSGLGFASPDGVGAYVAMMDNVPRLEPEMWGFIIECRSGNRSVLHYCRKRGFEILGNRLVFHRWMS